MKKFGPPPAKREELKTYRELGLDRQTKSFRGRRRLSGGGPRLLIGGEETNRPALIVSRELYQQTRAQALHDILLNAWEGLADASGVNLNREGLLDALKPQIERETYDRLAHAHYQVPRLNAVYLRVQERAPTAEEHAAFPLPQTPATYSDYRSGLLDSLLGQVQARQAHNPARYQTVWAQLVGPEIAQQSRLEKIAPESATAYFRCLNSALSYQLQRRPDLPKQLARALKLPIRQLRVLY